MASLGLWKLGKTSRYHNSPKLYNTPNFTYIHWKAQYMVSGDITRTNPPACYPTYIKGEDLTLRIVQFYSKQEIIWNTRNWSHSIYGLHLADCHALNHELKFKTFTKVSNTSPSYLALFSPSFMFLTFSVTIYLHTILKVYFCLPWPRQILNVNIQSVKILGNQKHHSHHPCTESPQGLTRF